jgi:hypothetical protein
MNIRCWSMWMVAGGTMVVEMVVVVVVVYGCNFADVDADAAA